MTDRIIRERDAATLCALNEDDLWDVLMCLWCDHFHDMPLAELNEVQLRYFLCMELENTCQADSILNLTDEDDIFFSLPRMYQSLLEIGAPQTAQALKEFMELMPDGTFDSRVMPEWKWFFADPEREKEIAQIESIIADYPDGPMIDLYYRGITSDITVAEKLLEL